MNNDVFRVIILATRPPYNIYALLHCNTVTTETKRNFIVTKGVEINMATGNHTKRDVTSRTTVLCTGHVPMIRQATTIFTLYIVFSGAQPRQFV